MRRRAATWILAAASLAVAAWAWTIRSPGPTPEPIDETEALARLRGTLQRLGAENESFRRELDHMARRIARRSAPVPDPPPTRGPSPADPAARPNDELARLAREKVAAAVGASDEVWQEALGALVDLVNEGDEPFPALRDIYLSTDDDRTRRTMLPMMFYGGGGEESLAFIASEMITFDDPGFRTNMLGAVARVINPRFAGVFKGAFLAGLTMDDFRARAAAVYGLRRVDDPDVTEALFAAAVDPSEPVRRLALEALVSRGADREQLRTLVRRDPSAHLREVGECALLVADEG